MYGDRNTLVFMRKRRQWDLNAVLNLKTDILRFRLTTFFYQDYTSSLYRNFLLNRNVSKKLIFFNDLSFLTISNTF